MRFTHSVRWMGLGLLAVCSMAWIQSCQPKPRAAEAPNTTSPMADSQVAAASQSTRGQAAYLGYCAMCHGAFGAGDGPLAEELKRQGARVPAALNNRARLDRLGRAGLIHVITEGGAHTGRSNLMPPWGRTLDRTLIDQIADFVLVLPDIQPGPTAEVIRQFLSSPPGVQERGRELFVFYCTSCHGDYGKGDGRLADTLWARNRIRPRNLTDSSYFAHLSDEQIFATVSLGGAHMGKSTYMPAWSYTLPPGQIRDLLGYVRAISHTSPRRQSAARRR